MAGYQNLEEDIDLDKYRGQMSAADDDTLDVDTDPADDDAVNIEVIDDRAPDDRGKKNAHQVSDDDFDDGDIPDPADDPDERAAYVRKTKQRIKESTFRFHAERRSREDAERKAAAAFELARSYMTQMQQIQTSYRDNEKFAVGALAEAAQREVGLLSEQLQKAHAEADPEAIVKYQKQLHDQQLKLAQLGGYRPAEFRAPNPEQDLAVIMPQIQQQEVARPRVDPDTEAWARRNPWFNSDETMTKFARQVDAQLQARGVNPLTDKKTYFTTIDNAVRHRFTDYPWLDSKGAANPPPVVTAGARPTSRSAGRDRKVTLTRSQLEVAKHLGITPEAYAKELMKLKTGGNA